MKSVMIEFLREGDPREGTINKDKSYLVTSGPDQPVRSVRMPCGHTDIQRYLSRLRYRSSREDQEKALEQLSNLMTDLLAYPALPGEPMQVDLVVTVAEIGALPFEAAKTVDGQWLFVASDKVVVPTRRVRGEFEERKRPWPARPRVLFVYANPPWLKGAPEVPAKAHEQALEAALKPWLEPLVDVPQAAIPDASSVLVKKEVSLADLKRAIDEARHEGKPFTHIHVLAHGVRFVEDKLLPDHYEYGLALNSEKEEPVKAEQLAEAVLSQDSAPVTISLAVCDGGNQANSAFRVESLAQSLHRAGVPVVVASQLPLTFSGSVVLTAKFYDRLFSGQDVRLALHQTRVALFQASPDDTHDWLSFVAYVRLPEGYADHLDKVSLEAALASLETASRWAKHIEDHNIQAGPTFDHVVDSLEQRIDALTKSLENNADEAERREIREEKTGLLGSANKRLAQFFFIRSKADAAREEEWQQKSRQALERARDAYRMDWMAHWNGVQYLALQAVLTGKIKPAWRWDVLREAAEAKAESEEEYWALGSSAELYLLGQLIGKDNGIESAKDSLRRMKARVAKHAKDNFPIQSTIRQFARYKDWWTKEYGFFGTKTEDLAREASELVEFLEKS